MNTWFSPGRGLGCAVAATALAVLVPGQAQAEDDLDLSRDGRTWTSDIDAPLFEESMLWVPGDSESERFYVRGRGGTAGDLTVDVVSAESDPLLESGDLRITARGGGGVWTPVDAAGTQRLLSTPNLPDGAVLPVTVTATFDAAATNTTQLRATRLRFRVTLAESISESIPEPIPEASGQESAVDDDGLLPDTGGPPLWLVVAGMLLGGWGASVVSRRDAQPGPRGREAEDG